MKHLKPYNESVKDFLKGKSRTDVINAINRLTPYGAYYRIRDLDLDYDEPELVKIIDDRIKESFDELDEIIDEHTNSQLGNMIDKVAEWIKKNGGNDVNLTGYGFPRFAGQIVSYGVERGRQGEVIIYDETVFSSFKQLLKNFAICEVKNNNIESDYQA